MKGYSTTMIIGIIIAVIIGVIVLYMFWSKGMLPFTQATSESQCKAYLMSDCDKVSSMGGWGQLNGGTDVKNIFSNIANCGKFLGSDNLDKCVMQGSYTNIGPSDQIKACQDLCSSVGSVSPS